MLFESNLHSILTPNYSIVTACNGLASGSSLSSIAFILWVFVEKMGFLAMLLIRLLLDLYMVATCRCTNGKI